MSHVPDRLASTARRTTARLRHCVRRARAAVGLTREACARDVGVSDDTVLRWESGRSKPDIDALLDAPLMGPAFAEELRQLLAARRAA